MWKTHTIMFN